MTTPTILPRHDNARTRISGISDSQCRSIVLCVVEAMAAITDEVQLQRRLCEIMGDFRINCAAFETR